MKNTLWKKFEKLTDVCYTDMIANMVDAEKKNSSWEQAFEILMEIVRAERKENPTFAPEFDMLDDITNFKYDISGWMEDCLDEMDMREQYKVLLNMCDALLNTFSWPEYTGSDLKFRKAIVLEQLDRLDDAVKFCGQWLDKEPENIEAATASVYVLTNKKEFDKAEQLIHKFILDENECCEENEIMFLAAAKLYEASGDKKKKKQLDKVIKKYEEEEDKRFMEWIEDDGYGEDDWDDLEFGDDDLPFN